MRIDLGGVDGDRLHIEGDDLGQGPAVVLVHGWPGSSLVWDDLRARLLGDGYRVLTYDRRGFGRSGRPSGGYDLDTLAEDLGRVLALRNLDDATVVGWDLGCAEVIRWLGSTGDARVGRIALIAPRLRRPDEQQALSQALLQARFAALDRDLLASFQCDCAADHEAARRAWWHDGCATAAHALLATLPLYGEDLADDCRRLGLPTLVIGDDTAGHPPPALAGIAAATRHRVRGGSPALLPTHGAEVHRLLLDFLAAQHGAAGQGRS